MIDFKFRVYSPNLGTRILGNKVGRDLLETIERNPNEKIFLDFSGIDIVSNAFADECLVKTSEKISLSLFISRTSFTHVNDLAKTNIAIAFKRRYPNVKKI